MTAMRQGLLEAEHEKSETKSDEFAAFDDDFVAKSDSDNSKFEDRKTPEGGSERRLHDRDYFDSGIAVQDFENRGFGSENAVVEEQKLDAGRLAHLEMEETDEILLEAAMVEGDVRSSVMTPGESNSTPREQ